MSRPQLVSVSYNQIGRKEKVKNALVIFKKTHQIATRFLRVYNYIKSTRRTITNQTEE